MWYIILGAISILGILFNLYLSAQLQQALEDNERLRVDNNQLFVCNETLKNEKKTLSDKVYERSLESTTYLSLYLQEVNKRDSMEELLDLYIEEQFKQNKWPTF